MSKAKAKAVLSMYLVLAQVSENLGPSVSAALHTDQKLAGR
jgi:hypothetical protein